MGFINNFIDKIFYIFRLFLYKHPSIYYAYSALTIYQFRELMNRVKFFKKDIVLDLGCGDGLLTIIIGIKCRKIYGIDISVESINKAKIRSSFIKKKANSDFKLSRLEEVGFKSEFFDKITSICVLEHIDNHIEVLKEIFRTLKKGGQFIFSVDSLESIKNSELVSLHKKKFTVERYYNDKDLKNLLESIGFININIKPICKSKYAKKLLIKGICDSYNFFRLFTPINYFLLKYIEFFCKFQNQGLFLVVNCYK